MYYLFVTDRDNQSRFIELSEDTNMASLEFDRFAKKPETASIKLLNLVKATEVMSMTTGDRTLDDSDLAVSSLDVDDQNKERI